MSGSLANKTQNASREERLRTGASARRDEEIATRVTQPVFYSSATSVSSETDLRTIQSVVPGQVKPRYASKLNQSLLGEKNGTVPLCRFRGRLCAANLFRRANLRSDPHLRGDAAREFASSLRKRVVRNVSGRRDWPGFDSTGKSFASVRRSDFERGGSRRSTG